MTGHTGSHTLWTLVGIAVRVFYRIERTGPSLPDGPLLLVANHPNTLLDPAVIQTTTERPIRFLAKSTLFERHILSPLIRRSGAIPVYRRMDAGVDTSRNTEMFAAVEQSLTNGHAICLFPEGISHLSGHLEPLRTGAARMALGSAANGQSVSIVPVGLNFDRLPMFRSRVTAVFGRPFSAEDLVTSYRKDPPAAAQALTDRIARRLRTLLIEADPKRDLQLVDRIDRLYSSARGVSRAGSGRVGRRRLIAYGIERLRRDEPVQYEEILDELRRYDTQLQRLGLRESDLDRRMPAREVVAFGLREGSRALVLGPLALLGFVCFAAPYYLTWGISRQAPDLQSRAAWQVVAGTLVYGVWIAGLATLGGMTSGPATGVALAGGLCVLAFVGLTAFEREAAVIKLVRAFLATRQTPLRARASLRRQRAALATVLDRVKEWLDEQEPATGPSADRPVRRIIKSRSY